MLAIKKRRIMKNQSAFAIAFIILLRSTIFGEPNMKPVFNFELNKYLGNWFEIARLPASFENNLIEVTATYSLNKNGKVKVENSGINKNTTKMKIAIGKAKIAKTIDIGYLKVSFFWPFYADYLILELDSNYQYAMVASSQKYLWILSRTPKMEKGILDNLIEKAKSLGFATDKLYFTPQQNG
jgi:apolipoprotein D and lipocalin family protein